jgi:hypothetical protein
MNWAVDGGSAEAVDAKVARRRSALWGLGELSA